nr:MULTISPECIES: hypothetical protein [Bifidobacterium]
MVFDAIQVHDFHCDLTVASGFEAIGMSVSMRVLTVKAMNDALMMDKPTAV